jgi:hypothetical protein
LSLEGLYAVFERLSTDPAFLARVAQDPAALAGYDLSPEERTAIFGHVRDILRVRQGAPPPPAAEPAPESTLAAEREVDAAILFEFRAELSRLRARVRALESSPAISGFDVLRAEVTRLTARQLDLQQRLAALQGLADALASLRESLARVEEALRRVSDLSGQAHPSTTSDHPNAPVSVSLE